MDIDMICAKVIVLSVVYIFIAHKFIVWSPLESQVCILISLIFKFIF